MSKMLSAIFVLYLSPLLSLLVSFINMYRQEDGDIMKNKENPELIDFLKELPPVEFCCIYGSTLHPNNHDKVLFVFAPPFLYTYNIPYL